ncbi:hypothetical protein J4E85_009803 [Alternaria conjuncta]|uniref:uncharacterized protein n=1 Tax=Alternaria conjuncta TaxID=181017 RepID=UPI0022204059|nr:uncharacterized protein J4E85_009803 [Alternaria conjuncta]KAI4917711.1 hypothetical protein J4E85_009803 [Alternaria conjuncta]
MTSLPARVVLQVVHLQSASSNCVLAVMSPNGLGGRPPTQFLPPAGAYYDQFDIIELFGPDIPRKGLCSHCLQPGCRCLCAMAYCSYRWRKDHGCTPDPDDMIALRPGMNQVADLHGLGIIQTMSHVSMDVLPNMDNADVKEYYAGHTIQRSHRIRTRTPITWVNENGKRSAAMTVKVNPNEAVVGPSNGVIICVPDSQVHDLPFIDPQLAQAIRQVTEEPSSHPLMSIPGLWLQPRAPPDNNMQLQIIASANAITIPSSSTSESLRYPALSPTASLQLHYEKLLHEPDQRELQYIAESKDKDRMIRTLKAKLGWSLE